MECSSDFRLVTSGVAGRWLCDPHEVRTSPRPQRACLVPARWRWVSRNPAGDYISCNRAGVSSELHSRRASASSRVSMRHKTAAQRPAAARTVTDSRGECCYLLPPFLSFVGKIGALQPGLAFGPHFGIIAVNRISPKVPREGKRS